MCLDFESHTAKNVVEQCQQQLHREEKLGISTAYVVHIISSELKGVCRLSTDSE